MSLSVGASYDEIPYEGFALYLMHPNHLAALGRLYAMTPPEVENCRVLEVGCARGDNLIPMAFSLPRAQFVGIDVSPRQVADGRAAIAELGLENIELHELSILDVGSDFGRFDFIVAHGVFSWVSEEIQERLLRFCAEALTPHGLAYISYNTHPGWHMGAMVRDMMFFHARELTGGRERVRASRDLLRILSRALLKGESPYARALREEADLILSRPDSYLYHEYLEESNRPMYVHEFVARAGAAGLYYVAEAKFGNMAAAQPPELLRPFGDSADWLAREQYYDYLKGQSFRQAVLCREGVACSRAPTATGLMSLRIAALVRPAPAGSTPSPDGAEEFRNFHGDFALSTNDPVIGTALRILAETWPRSLPFEALWSQVQDRLAGRAAGPDHARPSRPAASPSQLAETLLAAAANDYVEVQVLEPEFATAIGEFPCASPIARRQVAAGPRVANLRHRMITLMDFDQFILPRLDGHRDRSALLAELQTAVQDGVFTIQAQGRPITDPAETEPLLARQLEESLRRFAVAALLVG
ncbi:MAG TPA: class I SAM-dependent methyltransferase [Isosphaeraceae bacterium]|nr:class I SAM-dependent methyltransferase [Isosphaeraceae bacterium]